LDLAGHALFTPHGADFQLAHRADGACVFLREDGRCRIHARDGEAAKPLACRLYPFRFVPLGSQVRVDVRFDCPSTAGNFGRPIPAYRSALLELLAQAVPEQAATLPVPPLYGAVQPTWAQLCRITETFERLLLDETLDLTRRVVACVNLAALLRQPRVITLEGRKLSELLDTVASKVREAAGTDALRRVAPPGMVRTTFRQLIGVYGRLDRVGEQAQLLRRLKLSLRMLAGTGLLPPLRDDLPAVAFAAIEQAGGIPAHGAAQVVERYLHFRFAGMGFFGRAYYQRGYLDGMNALLLTYPLICWFARVFAAGEGLPTPNAACVERALMIVDHQHGITPVLDFPSERFRTHFLCERSTLRSLVIWYGS
jgi:lysine-N-methylase